MTIGDIPCSFCGHFNCAGHHGYPGVPGFYNPHPIPQQGSIYWVPTPLPVTLEAIRQIIREELDRRSVNSSVGRP